MTANQATERMFCYICDHAAAEILDEPHEYHGRPCCLAIHDCGYACTLAAGHDGPHRATTSATCIAARWSA